MNRPKPYVLDPGKGISCGSQECHKYASCTLQFGTKNIQQCKVTQKNIRYLKKYSTQYNGDR